MSEQVPHILRVPTSLIPGSRKLATAFGSMFLHSFSSSIVHLPGLLQCFLVLTPLIPHVTLYLRHPLLHLLAHSRLPAPFSSTQE